MQETIKIKNANKLLIPATLIMAILAYKRHKKIKLSVEGNTETEVCADRDMINTILRNLLSNSIKFSNEDSEIKIHSSVSKGKAVVHVIDQGVGIREERIPSLLSVTSEFGHGSDFCITIPLTNPVKF